MNETIDRTNIRMASKEISSMASVDPGATLGEGVSIGPFAVIEDDVVISIGVEIQAHAHIRSGARIGADAVIFTGASIGAVPQDLKFGGESTLAIVGERTVIREYVTVHRGTTATGRTVIGSDCLVMAYCHVAHDCVVGDRVILANGTQLGGHVHIDDWAVVGGLVGIHQFEHIGRHAMVGAGFRVMKDIPPYVVAGHEPIRFNGINTIGLRRRGFSDEQIAEITEVYRLLYRRGLNTADAIENLEREMPTSEFMTEIVAFVRGSTRGIIPGRR